MADIKRRSARQLRTSARTEAYPRRVGAPARPGPGEVSRVLDAIKNRSSARVPYNPTRRPSVEDISLILEAARWAPTAHNMQNFEIVVVDDPSLLDAFGGIESQISETFLRENYDQMSFSEEELLSKKVGVLASMFPPSWRSLADITSGQAEADGQRNMGSWLQHAPHVLVVIYDSRLRAPASEGDALGKISLGCVLENMWLIAETLGISCQVMSAFSSEQVEPQVRRLIGFPEHMRIAFVCRLGYAVPRPSQLRVRREVVDFTHHNRFGTKGLN